MDLSRGAKEALVLWCGANLSKLWERISTFLISEVGSIPHPDRSRRVEESKFLHQRDETSLISFSLWPRCFSHHRSHASRQLSLNYCSCDGAGIYQSFPIQISPAAATKIGVLNVSARARHHARRRNCPEYPPAIKNAYRLSYRLEIMRFSYMPSESCLQATFALMSLFDGHMPNPRCFLNRCQNSWIPNLP